MGVITVEDDPEKLREDSVIAELSRAKRAAEHHG